MLKQYSDYKSLIAKTFDGNVKNESCKCYLGNKEQKAMFLVVSRSDVHFSFEYTFFYMPDRARMKNRAP